MGGSREGTSGPGGSLLTGVPSSPFSPRSPCSAGQQTPVRGRKAQVTSNPLLFMSPSAL